jgi:hypothetical protein
VALRAENLEVEKSRKFGLLQFTVKNLHIARSGTSHVHVDGVSECNSLC